MSDALRLLRLRRRVAFSETDAAGIVHFSQYFRYFEDAEHALWREAGLSIHFQGASIGWPRVAAACQYHRPLAFEQEFEVRVGIAGITNRTIRYEGTIVTGDEQLVATAAWKIACVEHLPERGMKSTNIPPNIVERLEPYVHRSSDIGRRAPDAHRTPDAQ